MVLSSMSTTHLPTKHTQQPIDIEFTASVITSTTLGSLFAAILDLLLFQRNQIPFVYHTFKYMVEKFEALDGGEVEWQNYLIDRERKLASKTLYNVKMLKKNVAAELETLDIDRLLILFGPNALTAREAYEIHLPAVNRDHFGKNHIASDNTIVRRVSMSILSATHNCEPPSPLNQPTNVYVLLNPRHSSSHCTEAIFQRHDADYRLHPDCRTTIFRLRNCNVDDHHEEVSNNCCRDLIVFKDMAALHLESSDSNDSLQNTASRTESDKVTSSSVWFESDVFVTGYKDTPIKGKSIWI